MKNVKLTANALTVLEKRYLKKDESGKPVEKPEEMFMRVARNIALMDILYAPEAYSIEGNAELRDGTVVDEPLEVPIDGLSGALEPFTENDIHTLRMAYINKAACGLMKKSFSEVLALVKARKKELVDLVESFYAIMAGMDFLPNSPALMNAGRELQQLSACFVLPIEDSMVSIFDTLKHAALIHQSGGGTGFSFSRLRPKSDVVRSTGGIASGPVSFMKVYNAATEAVKQGGCVVPETLVTTNRGIVPIRELGPEDAPADTWHRHAQPLVVATDDGPQTSDEFYNHGVSPIRRIRTKHGYHLAATPEHRIRVIDEEGHYVWRHLRDVKLGDWVVLQKGHLLEPEDYSLPSLCEGPHFNAKEVHLPAEASEELGEFVGYLIGDNHGGTTGRLIFTVCDEQPEVAEWLLRVSGELFGITPVINKKENDGSTNYFFNSTTLVNWLRRLGVEKPSAKEARIPRIIFRKGVKMARGFLRGLFTADGTVSEEGYPLLSSASEALIDDVQQLLLAVGIPSSVSVATDRAGALGNGPVFRLRAITRAGLELFARTIGFIDGERNALLARALDGTMEFNDVIPNQEEVMAQHLTRSRLAALAENHKEIRNSHLAWFLTGDQFYDQIESIEEGESVTLDLSVPANNTYIANGFVSHNTRRGANMGILRVDHPDIIEFIKCKEDNREVTNFNISVAITDAFMKAVADGAEYELINPRNGEVTGRLNARTVFDLIVEHAWRNGEPGVIFIDRINQYNPTPHAGQIESTNPCGEQPLLPYEACCLASVNLSNMVEEGETPRIDWQRLECVVRSAVHFLDNLIDANRYPLPEIQSMVNKTRKVGLGVMGWADMLIKLRVPYNSEEAVKLAEEVMSFIREKSMDASEKLAEHRGVFPLYPGSVYDVPGGRKMRNATTTTIAPTGTISIIAGTSSGIEPIFSIAFTRNVMDKKSLIEINPLFEKVARERGFYTDELMERIARTGSLEGVQEVPEDVRKVFVTAHDISPEWHVRMQAAFQKCTHNAVSKTVNFPNSATKEDVATVYKLAYELGCKGVTVYRDGSREEQVLTKGAQPAKVSEQSGEGKPVNGQWGKIRPIARPKRLQGFTDVKETPLGKLFLTLNLLDGHPIEMFAQIGKAGSDVSAFTEGIARLISLALRSGIDPTEVADQLLGIGGSRSVGYGPNRVRSVPDAIGQFLSEYLNKRSQSGTSDPKGSDPKGEATPNIKSFSICPVCGLYSLAHVEGCLKCYACGHSEC